MSVTVKALCASLQKYYSSIGKETEYLNDKGTGLFTAWCDQNGVDDETLQEEFASDPEESLLSDFPLALPPDKQGLDEGKKREAVFQILQQCREEQGFPAASVTVTQEMLDGVNDADIEKVKPLYKKYCPAIYNKDLSSDNCLLFILALQHKYQMDFLSNLVDSFNRYRVLVDPGISPGNWGALDDNAHFTNTPLNNAKVNIGGKPTEYRQVATMGVGTFGNRCCAALMMRNNPRAIDDSIEAFVKYLVAATDFVVGNLVKSNKQICPFQIDFGVAVRNVTEEKKEDVDDGSGDDTDDDDDEPPPKNAETNQQADFIQNIAEKLKRNKLKHTKDFLPANDQRAMRRFPEIFRSFLTKNQIPTNEDKGNHYLRRKRLIAMIDRRKDRKEEEKQNADGDDMYFYEPPNDTYTRNMPPSGETVNEWFISSTKTCILPNVGYDPEVAVGNKTTKQSAGKDGANIGASDHANGSLITLSFHVFSEEKIKLYLYWQGQMIRFLPEDIKLILPDLFVKNKGNKSYIKDQSEELEKLITKLKEQLVDKQFEDWLKLYPVPKTKFAQ